MGMQLFYTEPPDIYINYYEVGQSKNRQTNFNISVKSVKNLFTYMTSTIIFGYKGTLST
jgi:hypothetical protein